MMKPNRYDPILKSFENVNQLRQAKKKWEMRPIHFTCSTYIGGRIGDMIE